MVLGRPEIFICSDTNPLFQRIVNLNLRPDDVVPFPTTHLETIHIESRPMAVRIRMENYMREQGYSDEEIQRVTHPRSQSGRGCSYQRLKAASRELHLAIKRLSAAARERPRNVEIYRFYRERYIRNRDRCRMMREEMVQSM